MIAHVTLTKLMFVPSFKGLTSAWGYVLCIERNLMIVHVHHDMQILVGRNTVHTTLIEFLAMTDSHTYCITATVIVNSE